MSKVLAFRRARPQVSASNRSKDSQAASASSQASNRCVLLSMARQPREERQPAGSLLVSVVVLARGRAELLNRCIASLVLQNFDPFRYEIIVVDDGSPSAVRAVEEVITRWTVQSETGVANGPSMMHLPCGSEHIHPHPQGGHARRAASGAAAARNTGWRAARADIIAFTEEDTVARADWLMRGLAAFRNTKIDAAWGKVIVPPPAPHDSHAKSAAMATREAGRFSAANCFCRKEVLEDVNGFDEAFDVASREDVDLYLRLITMHARIVHQTHAIMNRPRRPMLRGRSGLTGLGMGQIKRVQYDALLYKKHPQLYREKIRSRPRRDFYLMTISLPLALAALAADQVAVGLTSGLLWLLLAQRFCRQRLREQPRGVARTAQALISTVLLPPMSVLWRLAGAWRFRVLFL